MILMNQNLLYQWQRKVSSRFSSLTVWQQKRLAIFSLGVLLAEHCHQSKIAKAVSGRVKADSSLRQLQRYTADKNWPDTEFSQDWTRWAVSLIPKKRKLMLLVDETSIGDRFRVMMVGAA